MSAREAIAQLSSFFKQVGNFLISLDRGYIRFRFKISMHIDNLEALNIIKSKLNIGKITIEKDRNRCSFVVQDFIEIRDVICPIFIQFPLPTLLFFYFHPAPSRRPHPTTRWWWGHHRSTTFSYTKQIHIYFVVKKSGGDWGVDYLCYK